ncbi:MAG: hypothetical protein JRD68_11125, partial [Deltaproteobacteria bacterium]|nr:hypothetical protein [Deltaproteobacteria bacterium]
MTLDFLKHPVIVLVSLVIAVLSVSLTVYFYIGSREFREPVYLVEEEHKQIFDSKASSPKIKVLDKDSNPITDNIFLATVAFWNAGKLSIEPEDVRVPLQIQIKSISKLLDCSIVKETDSEITKFQLSESLGLSWSHFDPGCGAKVQLIYSAPVQAGIEITGKIKGVAEIRKFSSTRRINITWLTMIIFASIGALYGALQVFIGIRVLEKAYKKSKGRRRLLNIT